MAVLGLDRVPAETVIQAAIRRSPLKDFSAVRRCQAAVENIEGADPLFDGQRPATIKTHEVI